MKIKQKLSNGGLCPSDSRPEQRGLQQGPHGQAAALGGQELRLSTPALVSKACCAAHTSRHDVMGGQLMELCVRGPTTRIQPEILS